MSLRYLFLGDAHGDLDFAERAAYLASEEGITEIIQVGDWGFQWPRSNQVNDLVRLLEQYGVTMRFIDGNHDDHPWLEKIVTGTEPIYIAPGLVYQPRGSTYTDADGTRFLFCGGAPSIDKEHRIAGRSWWPEETISEEQFSRSLAAEGPFDVLVTHDAAAFPPGYGPKGTPEFQELGNRSLQQIAALVEKHEPSLHVHGHWHLRYERDNSNVSVTRTVGLASNLQTLGQASMIWVKE